jgi:CheY-like chemotaxis protein
MNLQKTVIEGITSREPVLIVEDKKENQDLLLGLCKRIGLSCDIADNGQIALSMLEKRKYPIYIVDLMMPVMDGRTFIEHLKKKYPDAVILVQTATDSSETIIPIMKLGVFDYIIKPIDPELFTASVLKAIDYYSLKNFEREQNLAAGHKIRNQIEWLSYKESLRMSDSTDAKSIYNLKTSLAQGAGFGSLVTLIDMLIATSEKSGDKYMIDSQIIDLIKENNEYCRLQIEGLHSAVEIMEQEFSLESHDASDLVSSLPEFFSRVTPFLGEKKLTLKYPELRNNCKLSYNQDKIALVLEELLVNVFKYALPGTTVNIFTRISDGYFWVSLKNDIRVKPYGGIPQQYEKLVIEPFFRLQPPDESAGRFERIGFGLGLTVTDSVMKKHNGLFIIHDVKDLTGDRERLCVLAEILLPVI